MATEGNEDVKLSLKPVPLDLGEYPKWRFGVRSKVLSAAKDPVAALRYLNEMDDPRVATTDLPGSLEACMMRVDVKLFSELVNAVSGNGTAPLEQALQTEVRFGCGRQAMRTLDIHYRHQSTLLAVRVSSLIQELTCAGLGDLERYMSQFVLYRQQMGQGEHKLSDSMGLSLLKRHLKNVNQAKATFANHAEKVRASGQPKFDELLKDILQSSSLIQPPFDSAQKLISFYDTPHPLPCHGNCFLLLKHPAQLHAQRKMYQGQVISGLCGLLQVAWACKFIGLKVTSCWERSSSALPAVPKKLICSAFRWLNSLMRGRLSWLLLAAALQGSASTRSPECRELDVVVGSIDYMSMRLCSVQVSVPVNAS